MKNKIQDFIMKHVLDISLLCIAGFTIIVPKVFSAIICTVLSVFILVCMYDIYMFDYHRTHKKGLYTHKKVSTFKWDPVNVIFLVCFLSLLYFGEAIVSICFTLLLILNVVILQVIESHSAPLPEIKNK